LKLLKLTLNAPFNSLQAGFVVNFHPLKDKQAMEDFRPFCFAGLNGSGKSNVLEALSSIFYHLEFCVARYKPANFEKHFDRKVSKPDAFQLEYLIGQHNRKQYSYEYFDKVIILKNAGEEPKMFILPHPFYDEPEYYEEISLVPSKSNENNIAAEGKSYLPAHIIAYSSGENEILSLPFIKSRLVHLDEFKQATKDNYSRYEEPENSLIYIDNNMSQAVLLACLLFENEDTLKPLKDEVGILGLRSFRMNINLHDFDFVDEKGKAYKKPIISLLEHDQINKLKRCATSWFQNNKKLCLDFYVTKATIDAFQNQFSNSLEVFQLFRLLYELNAHFINENIVEDVYQSKGFYTDGKMPVGSPDENVFYFLDYYITKKNKETGEINDLLLRNFSDGEHQFLHTMGICLLLKDKRALLLLDEPETHFNPSWRAKFIKVLKDSITLGNYQNHPNGFFNLHSLKDVILTSHSPFIISDCMPDNVIVFSKKDGKTIAQKVSELERPFNTYGTSVEIILNELFDYDQSIGDLSNSELEKIDFEKVKTLEDIENVKFKLRRLGESIEKDEVLARLNRILKPIQ
jgi:restriction system-associated AAA family ATPase